MGVTPRTSKVGVNIATSGSWALGAAVATAVGAGDGHYVLDDIGQKLKVTFAPNVSAGQDFISSIQGGPIEPVTGSLPMFLSWVDAWQNPLLALALGTGGTAPAAIGTSTIAKSNTFEPAVNKNGLYATIVRDEVQQIKETPGAKFTGFEIRNGEGGRIEIEFFYTGDTAKTDSAINTATQVSALTFPALGSRFFFDDLVIRINAQSGSGLAASDAVKVTGFKLRYTQPVDTKHVGGSRTIVEPQENKLPTVSLELTFARFDATSVAFFAGHRDITQYKADLTFDSGSAVDAIGGNYALLIQLPNLVVPDYESKLAGNEEEVAPKMTLHGYKAASAPTGMTGVTAPLRVTTTGTATANPFV